MASMGPRAEARGRWLGHPVDDEQDEDASMGPRAEARGRGPLATGHANGRFETTFERQQKPGGIHGRLRRKKLMQLEFSKNLRAPHWNRAARRRSHSPPTLLYHKGAARGRVRLSQDVHLVQHGMRCRTKLNQQNLILAMVNDLPQQLAQRRDLATIKFAQKHTVLHVIPVVLAGLKDLRPPLVVGDVVGHQEVVSPCDPAHLVTIPT